MNKISGHCRLPWQRTFATIAPRQTLNEQIIAGVAKNTIGFEYRETAKGKKDSEKPIYGYRMPEKGEVGYDEWLEQSLLFMEKVKNEKK